MNQATKLIRGSALALVVATAAVVGTPGDAAAAGTGTWMPAQVQCDALNNHLVITPVAGAMAGYNSQQISYRFWVYNRTTRTYLWKGNSTTWGSFVHTAVETTDVNPFDSGGEATVYTPGPIVGPATTITSLPDGEYQVLTQYAWNNGGWDYAAGWSNLFYMPYWHHPYYATSCLI